MKIPTQQQPRVPIGIVANFANKPSGRPRTPWHVGPLKVGLLSANNAQWKPVVAASDGNEKVKRILHQKKTSL